MGAAYVRYGGYDRYVAQFRMPSALPRSLRSAAYLSFPVVALSASVLVVAGQQPAPQTPPQFRSTTDMVLLDVSVIDKNRRPVRGLTEADFTILEDGVKQEIGTFKAVDLPDAEVPSAKWMGRAPLDVQTNAMPDGRLVLIYLDERQINASPFSTKTAMDTAHAVIDQLSPSDVAAVGFVLDHKGAQEFTTDRARLHAAVDTFAASPPVGVSILGTLRDLSRLFVSIPERRKIIIYIGVGQGYDLEVLAGMDKMTMQSDTTLNFTRQGQQDQFNALMSLVQMANRANVSIYTVDPNGLDNSPPGSSPKEFLRLVANTTGARAVIGNNSPQSQVPIILGENASYYLLAYRSANTRNEGKFRQVSVKVNRPNVEVRSRRGYVEGRTAGVSTAAGVNPALGRLIPATQLALGLWAVPAASETSGSHTVAMMIDVDIPRDGARPNEHLAVAWSIVDMSGKERGTGRQDLTVSPPAGTEDYVATVQSLATLPPGRYDIRVSAQLVERNRRGGLLGDVVVPDFAKDGLSTSGVFVGEIAPASTRANELARLMSLKPTTDRTFTATAPIVAAMRIYQAKQPAAVVTVKATVLDSKDKTVFESVEKLDPAAFAGGSAEYRLPMPFAKIGAGPFLLRLEASRSGAQAVKREVRFSVK